MEKQVNPEMIVLARESRGLTQTELARNVSLSQAEISRYESGARIISKEHLDKIADELGYPESFFYQAGQRYGLGSSALYHRRRKSMPARLLDQVIAKVNILRLCATKLLEGVDIEHDRGFPQYDVEEFGGNVEQIAELVRAAWKLPAGPITDLVGAIENAGGIVHRATLGTRKVDAFAQWVPPTPPVFLINDEFPGDRLRFTLAHEIGHLVMHDRPRDYMEEEADRFASAFLMPARDILPHFDRVTLPRLAQLKPYWRVSMQALLRRALDLGAVSERQYRSLIEDMGKSGYRMQEPVQIPVEKPTLLAEIIDSHLNDLRYSIPELAGLLSLDEREFWYEYVAKDKGLRIVPPRGSKPISDSTTKVG